MPSKKTKAELLRTPIKDRDGSDRQIAMLDPAGNPTGEFANYTVGHVIRDAIFTIDSLRITQKSEELPERYEANLRLMEALNAPTTPLSRDDMEKIKGLVIGMPGSDVVKAQVLRVLPGLV